MESLSREFNTSSQSHGYLLKGFVAVPVLIVLKFIITFMYNIFFHSLRKYPGPKLAAGTSLIHTYYVIRGTETVWVQHLHETYGDVVRLGPDWLSYISPEGWRDVCGHRTGGRAENTKDRRAYVMELNNTHSILTIPDAKDHGKVRKIFSNAFSEKALKLQEGLIRGYVDKLVSNISKAIAKNPSMHLDFVKLYNCTTFDIMGDLTFGEPLGMLEASDYTPWVRAVYDTIYLGTIMQRIKSEYASIWTIIDFLMPKSISDLRRSHFNHTVERVNRRIEQDGNNQNPDIWRLVLNKGNKKLTVDEMHANAALFMSAGTETTATLLSGLTYLLLKNPNKMQKVVDEVRSLPFENLSLEALPRLPYLNACFEEGLRCYPPVPTGLPREAPKGGNAVCGEWVPEGTRMAVSFNAAFKSPRNFKDAQSFVPERWLSNSGYETDKRDAFQPFSFGPRNCLGKNLAYHEMRIILANVLWHFDLELCAESDGWMDQKAYTFWQKPELFVTARAIR